MLNDNIILEILSKYKTIHWKKLPDNILNYLNNRYDDSSSPKESFYRIKNNIEIRPVCKECGGYVQFKNTFNDFCSHKCSSKNNETIINRKKTCIKKYGENYGKIFYDKTKITNKKKYYTDHFFNSPQYKEKSYKTCIKKYGVNNWNKLDSSKNLLSEKLKIFYHSKNGKLALLKMFKTKKNNKTYNKSNEEDQSYELLKEKYSNVIRQYKSEQYPFNCDFYIPSLNLYIECNYHWSHGNKPYEGTKEDKNILLEWKNKNTKYYNNSIETWTIRDVNKRNISKQNKLNWLEFFNIQEFKNWINS